MTPATLEGIAAGIDQLLGLQAAKSDAPLASEYTFSAAKAFAQQHGFTVQVDLVANTVTFLFNVGGMGNSVIGTAKLID